MRRKNDLLWKGMLEEVFDDLLRFIFPDAEQVFDMQRGFEFLDKELNEIVPDPDKDPNTLFVDKLVKIYRLDGMEEWLLCHVEVQGHPDRLFPERMFRYYYRIFDRFRKPVTAIALFTGIDGKKMPSCYEHSFPGTHMIYQYNTLCILDYPEDTLIASENPFALVALTARKALLAGKVTEKELLEQKLLVARTLLRSGKFLRRKIEMILSFLKNYILFEDPQTNRIFDEEIATLTGEKNTMGLLEQIAEMRVQDIIENLLKKTDFPMEKIASLTNVPLSFVEEVRKGMLLK